MNWSAAALAALALQGGEPQAAECLDGAPPPAESAPAPAAPLSFERRTVGEGRVVVVATGRIGGEAAAFLISAVRVNLPFDEIWFEKVVADDDAATAEFARTLRGLNTPVRLRAGQVCVGGCAQAFVGSRIRLIDEGAWIGFARGPAAEAATPDGMSRDQVAALWAERRADDYIRSGISRGLLRLQLASREPSICYLSRQAIRRYNVAVEFWN